MRKSRRREKSEMICSDISRVGEIVENEAEESQACGLRIASIEGLAL
jgi:hypothetical protein